MNHVGMILSNAILNKKSVIKTFYSFDLCLYFFKNISSYNFREPLECCTCNGYRVVVNSCQVKQIKTWTVKHVVEWFLMIFSFLECWPGTHGVDCKEKCLPHIYGRLCKEKCRCTPCDKVTGCKSSTTVSKKTQMLWF